MNLQILVSFLFASNAIAMSSQCSQTATVEKGQSCRSIAKANGKTLNDLVSCNTDINCRTLKADSQICLDCRNPDPIFKGCETLYSSKDTDTCESLAASKGVSINSLTACNPHISCQSSIGFGVNVCLKCSNPVGAAPVLAQRLTAGVPDAGDACDCNTDRGRWIDNRLVCNYVTAVPQVCQWISINGDPVTSRSSSTGVVSTTPPVVVTPTNVVVTSTANPTETPRPTVIFPPPTSGMIFSPYKDASINMNWNTNLISSLATGGQLKSLIESAPSGMNAITLAFATGECGKEQNEGANLGENWGGVPFKAFIQANMPVLESAGLSYIISTGGANGKFTCGSTDRFIDFVQRYMTSRLIGIDFDIEASQTEAELLSLINGAIAANQRWPNLRFSFTIATLAQNEGEILNPTGTMVMRLLKNSGWNNYFINLMTMNYGKGSSFICILGADGLCDMGTSTVNAAKRLNADYGVPFNRIEVTPMIGLNDVIENLFYLKDVKIVTDFAKQVGLGGIHHWSFDRDINGNEKWASPTGNGLGNAGPGPLGFTKEFIKELGGSNNNVSTSVTVQPPPPVTTIVQPPPPVTTIVQPPPPVTTTTSNDVVQPTNPPPVPNPSGFLFAPYKDITINMDWNTNVISTTVTGSRKSLISVLPSGFNAVYLSFATGECGSENWGGVPGNALAQANIASFKNAGLFYVVSTGGAAGSFTCNSPERFIAFVERYYSSHMLGIDFDIEAGQTEQNIKDLINVAIAANQKWPSMRFSFTIACLGGNGGILLNDKGVKVMTLLKASGWSNYYVNLMTMDYGPASNPANCIVGSNGKCDMAASANNAAKRLNAEFGVPFNRIEVTPMIGGNDVVENIFTVNDIKPIVDYARQVGLAGIHHWSVDRDTTGPVGFASPIHNSLGNASPGPFGFTNAFISILGGNNFTIPPVVNPPVVNPPVVNPPVTGTVVVDPPTVPTNVAGGPNAGDNCDCSVRGQWILGKNIICNYVSSAPLACKWIQA